jgi:hypothetical protein
MPTRSPEQLLPLPHIIPGRCRSALSPATVSTQSGRAVAAPPVQVAGRLRAALHVAPWSLRLRSAAARALSDAGAGAAASAAALWPLRLPPHTAVDESLRPVVAEGRRARAGGALAAGGPASRLAAELQVSSCKPVGLTAVPDVHMQLLLSCLPMFLPPSRSWQLALHMLVCKAACGACATRTSPGGAGAQGCAARAALGRRDAGSVRAAGGAGGGGAPGGAPLPGRRSAVQRGARRRHPAVGHAGDKPLLHLGLKSLQSARVQLARDPALLLLRHVIWAVESSGVVAMWQPISLLSIAEVTGP